MNEGVADPSLFQPDLGPLFDSKGRSDCVIIFHQGGNAPNADGSSAAASEGAILGEPLPRAHFRPERGISALPLRGSSFAALEKDPEGLDGWFAGVDASDVAAAIYFICAPEAEQKELLDADTEPWFEQSLKAGPRTQCIPAADGLPYKWSITRQQLHKAVEEVEERDETTIEATFGLQSSSKGLLASGFEWRVCIILASEQPAAGLFLHCRLPDVMASLEMSRRSTRSTCHEGSGRVSAWLEVNRQKEGTQANVGMLFSSTKEFVRMGSLLGLDDLLPLRAQAAQRVEAAIVGGGNTAAGGGGVVAAAAAAAAGGMAAAGSGEADPLAAWVDYLQPDGGITGTLRLLRPK